jgi:hypothetical protein
MDMCTPLEEQMKVLWDERVKSMKETFKYADLFPRLLATPVDDEDGCIIKVVGGVNKSLA